MREPPSPAGTKDRARKSEATTEPMQRHEGARELNDYLQTPFELIGILSIIFNSSVDALGF